MFMSKSNVHDRCFFSYKMRSLDCKFSIEFFASRGGFSHFYLNLMEYGSSKFKAYVEQEDVGSSLHDDFLYILVGCVGVCILEPII